MFDIFSEEIENCPVWIYNDFSEASKAIAQNIIEIISKKENIVLGLCAGSSPSEVYSELVSLYKNGKVSFKKCTVFLIDEYYPIARGALQSKRKELDEKLFNHIDIPLSQINSLSGDVDDYESECLRYEEKIANAGGLDFLLVGVGGTGHLGGNEPGTHFESRTRRVPLDRVSRVGTASQFKGEEFVPQSALTMGLKTIMEAREIILLAFGEKKAKLIKNIVEGNVTNALPASILQNHSNLSVITDLGAAGKLTRIASPWQKVVCDWSDEAFVKKAVIWLAKHTEKSILKLTNRDYMDNGMGDLLNTYGSAYSINIIIFNKIQDTITGWPGGKPGVSDERRPERAKPTRKRVLVFSPHPDDDVISMGGTLQKLVDQNHDVHVAYQTNGNVAVPDHKVQELVDLLRELEKSFNGVIKVDKSKLNSIESFFKAKDPLAADTSDVQYLKTLIRKVETISACRYVGVDLDKNHHLDLPFYQTGEIRKKPLSQEDIDIIKKLLMKIKPHQIFAAGDLSDPHGTHRVCLNAIFEAINQLKEEKWFKDCNIWLYRGAWAEWPVNEADMAVPISPEGLMKKRISIFKHGSQKDGIVFPGADNREFWQRAEARNRKTAEIYNNLGFADYEAIELFVKYRGFELQE